MEVVVYSSKIADDDEKVFELLAERRLTIESTLHQFRGKIMSSQKRKLTTILAMDVVNYSKKNGS